MLPTILSRLAPLGTSSALHLITGLVLSATALIIISDQRLLILPFLVQRLLLIALLWVNTGESLAVASLVASAGVGLIYATTAPSLWLMERRHGRVNRRQLALSHPPFRVFVAALAVLLTYGAVVAYVRHWLPTTIATTVTWLIIAGTLMLVVPSGPLHGGLGILTVADAARVLYALAGPDALMWGLWAACDVLVALAASHLSVIELTTVQRAAPRMLPAPSEDQGVPGTEHSVGNPLPEPCTDPHSQDVTEHQPVPDQSDESPVDAARPISDEPLTCPPVCEDTPT